MLKELARFITDIYSFLTPGLALAGGVPLPPVKRNDKPEWFLAKGAGFLNPFNVFGGFQGATINPFSSNGGSTPSLLSTPQKKTNALPKPPAINIPQLPTPPQPPPPPTASSADVASAQQEGMLNAQRGFGFKASLLRGTIDPSTNMAMASGSLLGQ
jgi:hypothetical protein